MSAKSEYGTWRDLQGRIHVNERERDVVKKVLRGEDPPWMSPACVAQIRSRFTTLADLEFECPSGKPGCCGRDLGPPPTPEPAVTQAIATQYWHRAAMERYGYEDQKTASGSKPLW